MRNLLIAALAASLAVPASAREQTMTVTAHTSLNEWVSSASERLGRSLDEIDLGQSETGITYVRFTCSADGKAQNIATVATSDYKPNLDRVGREAVQRMSSLHPLFAGVKEGQVFEAAVVVADDHRQLRRLNAEVAKRAQRVNSSWAARGTPGAVISLAAVSGL